MINGSMPPKARIKRRRSRNEGNEDLTCHARRVIHLYPPCKSAVERLKLKLERKKEAERADLDQRDAACASGRKLAHIAVKSASSVPESSRGKHGIAAARKRNVSEVQEPASQEEKQLEGKQSADKAIASKRKASGNGGGRDKAREEEAIKRILKKRKVEAPDDETDDELIEMCWKIS